jgi:hypothetical protein
MNTFKVIIIIIYFPKLRVNSKCGSKSFIYFFDLIWKPFVLTKLYSPRTNYKSYFVTLSLNTSSVFNLKDT